MKGCVLCEGEGGLLLAKTGRWRIIRADEPGFPAFYRVIWNEHVAEFSDLSAAARAECMEVIVQVETLMRKHLAPTKVNLASLGNAVPHLHWHLVARYNWDSHFPGSVWSAPQRTPAPERIAQVQHARAALEIELAQLARAA